MSVLLIDDNPGDLFLMKRAIQAVRPGTVVVTSEGELPALQPRPALVLLDLNMPNHGHNLLTQLKDDPATRAIPVVIFSSSEAPEDVRQSYIKQANAYIVKPLSNDVLQQTLKTILAFWLDVNQVVR